MATISCLLNCQRSDPPQRIYHELARILTLASLGQPHILQYRGGPGTYIFVRFEEGPPPRSAVDTVERFQGGERTVVMVIATESDRGYLLASAGFLLDPRRLTVAGSLAKQKMILVVSRSVFSLYSPDEETFNNALLWKNLLARTCVNQLWKASLSGLLVSVWGGN